MPRFFFDQLLKISRRVSSYKTASPLEITKLLLQDLWWIGLAPYLWPATTLVFKLVAKSTRKALPGDRLFDRAIILSKSPLRSFEYIGQDLTLAIENWVRETLAIETVDRVERLQDAVGLGPNVVVIADRQWIDDRTQEGFGSLLSTAFLARRSGSPIWAPMPDCFYIRYSTYSSALVSLSGGATVLIPNSVREARKYGLPNPCGPHFWILPESEIALWAPTLAFEARPPLALMPGSGDSRRATHYQGLEERLATLGINSVKTSAASNLSWSDYASLSKQARVSFTTTWLQPFFHTGPRYYRRLLADGTITRRVWEAFGSQTVLVTQTCSALTELGFFAGIHFIEDIRPENGWDDWVLPEEIEQAEIAKNGYLRFLELIKESVKTSRVVA